MPTAWSSSSDSPIAGAGRRSGAPAPRPPVVGSVWIVQMQMRDEPVDDRKRLDADRLQAPVRRRQDRIDGRQQAAVATDARLDLRGFTAKVLREQPRQHPDQRTAPAIVAGSELETDIALSVQPQRAPVQVGGAD